MDTRPNEAVQGLQQHVPIAKPDTSALRHDNANANANANANTNTNANANANANDNDNDNDMKRNITGTNHRPEPP